VIARAVNGRLRDRTEDERRAVALYIASFIEGEGSMKHSHADFTFSLSFFEKDFISADAPLGPAQEQVGRALVEDF